MQELYTPFIVTGNPIINMDVKSAEMTKYASNSFLALKISYANEIANLCEAVGANAEMVRIGMCADKRIGSQFLFSGIGYGGSCFPKDVKALQKTAKENNCEHYILDAIDNVNKNQRLFFVNKILKNFNNDLKDKTLAVWGLAFKPQTNDMREAPSITIINELLKKGAKIQAFDPKAMETAKVHFGNKIIYTDSSYDAVRNADALLLLTEWNEFSKPDFDKIKQLMKSNIIFDGRNLYDGDNLIKKGFKYICIGKKY
jgi:UDPglucose 6-dehydrogenase